MLDTSGIYPKPEPRMTLRQAFSLACFAAAAIMLLPRAHAQGPSYLGGEWLSDVDDGPL